MRLALLTCPLVVFAVGSSAQTTHLVGPGGLPQIRDALAIAQPGDRIHVQPGTYAHFTATVGVTIRALVPGTVEVQFDPAYLAPGCVSLCLFHEGPTVISPPPGQVVHVVGLRFLPNSVTGQAFFVLRHHVRVGSGRVHFEGCSLQSEQTALWVFGGAQVHLRDSEVAAGFGAGGHGALLTDASLTAVGCTFLGGLNGGPVVGNGIQATNGTVQLGDCAVVGGNGVAPGLRGDGLAGAGSAWLHGCSLDGGCAVNWPSGATRFDACTFTSQLVGVCPTPANGPFLLGVEQPDPPLLGAPFALQWQTEPNGLVAVFASFGLGRVDLPGILAQPSWVDPASEFFLGALFADASGAATTTFALPANPLLTDLELWFQGVSGFAFPLQSSVPVGGVLR